MKTQPSKLIDAHTKSLIEFLSPENENKNINIVIPIFQRNYDWKLKQCELFFNDFENLINNKYEHFLGSIFYSEEVENKQYVIIDGQQRITTFTILLISAYKCILKQINKEPQNQDNQKILEKLDKIILKDSSNENDLRLKLKFSYKEQNDKLLEIFKKDPEEIRFKINESNIYSNFFNFYTKLDRLMEEKNISSQIIFDALERFIIVTIEIVPTENIKIQKIFETLNSTGIPLSQADLIRNYLLMDIESKEQENLHNNYWLKVEENVDNGRGDLRNNIDPFFRNYLIYRIPQVQMDDKDLYESYKKYRKNNENKSASELFEELKKYSSLYRDILNYKLFNDDIDSIKQNIVEDINKTIKYLIDVKYLGYAVAIPFIFYLYDKNKKGDIEIQELLDILKYTENFAFRRKIVGYGTSKLRGFFNSMIQQLNRLKIDNPNKSYYELYAYKVDTLMNVSDNEIINRLENYKLFKNNGDFCKNYVLYKIELAMSGDTKINMNNNEIMIDHILPLKYYKNINWDIKDKYSEVLKYIHSAGNLILTSKNSRLSNQTYEDKIRIYTDDNRYCKLSMVQDLIENYKEWNLDAILKRNKEMANIINKIWFANNSFEFEDIVDNKVTQREWEEFDVCDNDIDLDILTSKTINIQFKDEVFKDTIIIKQYIKTIYKIIKLDEDMFIRRIINDVNRNFCNVIADDPNILGSAAATNNEEITINNDKYYINKILGVVGMVKNLKNILVQLDLNLQGLVKILYCDKR